MNEPNRPHNLDKYFIINLAGHKNYGEYRMPNKTTVYSNFIRKSRTIFVFLKSFSGGFALERSLLL